MDADVTDSAESGPVGFVAFFRRYTRTWVHAVATAGLTAFGTLTVVHRGFAALALAAYAVPPVALYASKRIGTRDGEDREADAAPVGPDVEGVGSDAAVGGPDARGGDSAATSRDESGWTTADVAAGTTLLDAAVTPASAWAVGGDGVVLADRGDAWAVVLEDGPGANSNTLRGVDATVDGAAVWIAGDGGTVARLDAASGRHVDFSAPEGITDAWVDVAVGGASGSETVLLVNGSGEAVRGRYRDGEVAWASPVKPGGGSSFGGVDFADESTAYLCDTNDGVFETREARRASDSASEDHSDLRAGGETFRRVGIDGADGTLTDVAAVAREECLASADDGVVHRYDGSRWTPDSLDDGALLAVACHGGYAIVCGDGVVHERADRAGDWIRTATAATETLRGVAAGETRAVAVGDDGVVVERRL